MSQANQPIIEYVQTLEVSQFWGSITLKFEAGRVVHVRKEENLKPDELSRESRSCNGSSKAAHQTRS